jgi:trehalose 6-phosphate synthase
MGRAVGEAVGRINGAYGEASWTPVRYINKAHSRTALAGLYRAARAGLVTPLRDGMNLVAKEFVAARDDEQGILILSQFTGAASELPDALVVNPYNIDQCAAAMHLALTMPPTEQRARMRSMRGIVQEFNVFRWAGRMLMDAARMRQRARVERQTSARNVRTTTGGQA